MMQYQLMIPMKTITLTMTMTMPKLLKRIRWVMVMKMARMENMMQEDDGEKVLVRMKKDRPSRHARPPTRDDPHDPIPTAPMESNDNSIHRGLGRDGCENQGMMKMWMWMEKEKMMMKEGEERWRFGTTKDDHNHPRQRLSVMVARLMKMMKMRRKTQMKVMRQT